MSSQEAFLARVRRAMHVDVVQYITGLAQHNNVSLVVRWQSEFLDALEVDTALQQQGVTVHTTRPPGGQEAGETATAITRRRQELREPLAHAGMGLLGVDYVIAETGTLVLQAFSGRMRGVSLLPPVHVVHYWTRPYD